MIHPKKFTIDNLERKILSKDDDLSEFDCSDGDRTGVNEFIHEEAWQYQIENMGVTHLFYYGDKIVGFGTISMNSIGVKDCPDEEALEWFGSKRPPVVLLGQLGVDNTARKRNLGSILCDWFAGKAAELSQEIGCRYIALHADQEILHFYEQCDFETTNPMKKTPLMVRKIAKLDNDEVFE